MSEALQMIEQLEKEDRERFPEFHNTINKGGENLMEEANQTEKSLWDSINSEQSDLAPKIVFEVNKPQDVTFPTDFNEPLEFPSEDGPYCVFNVKQGQEDARIMTSAWTLLGGLKKLVPLAGKTVRIGKVLEGGKQRFVVEEITA